MQQKSNISIFQPTTGICTGKQWESQQGCSIPEQIYERNRPTGLISGQICLSALLMANGGIWFVWSTISAPGGEKNNDDRALSLVHVLW